MFNLAFKLVGIVRSACTTFNKTRLHGSKKMAPCFKRTHEVGASSILEIRLFVV